MGQKVHPIGFRLGVIKKHNALWYAKGKAFKTNLIEDLKVRNYIKERLRFSSISRVDLERSAQTLQLTSIPLDLESLLEKKVKRLNRLNQPFKS